MIGILGLLQSGIRQASQRHPSLMMSSWFLALQDRMALPGHCHLSSAVWAGFPLQIWVWRQKTMQQ